jgi:hypothetical protein
VGSLHGLGQSRRVRQPVVVAGVGEPLALGGGPQTGDDGQLLGEAVEPFAQRGKRDPVGGVLLFEPAGAEPELDPATAHGVDLGGGDGQRAGKAERGRGDERPEADARRLPGQGSERDPGVGRAGPCLGPARVAAHPEKVVGAEEGIEAEPLRLLGDGQLLVVRGALLGLGEDA